MSAFTVAVPVVRISTTYVVTTVSPALPPGTWSGPTQVR
jgi:hypothetical protein